MPAAFVTASFLPFKPNPFALKSRRTAIHSPSTRRPSRLLPISAAHQQPPASTSNGVAKDPNWHHSTKHISSSSVPSNSPCEHDHSTPSTFLNLSSTPGIKHVNTKPGSRNKRTAANNGTNNASSAPPESSLFNPSSENAASFVADHTVHPAQYPASHNMSHIAALSNSITPASEPKPMSSHSKPPLPRVLIIHCGGTFGMQQMTTQSSTTLKPTSFLADLQEAFPELNQIASLNVSTPMNLDSTRMGPDHWIRIAKLLDKHRDHYDGFVIIHGTDTMSYTGAALSLMLAGFRKPVVLTGSQRPMLMPRSDARQNLVDAVTVACQPKLQEFAVCFGGLLLRANRAMKYSSSAYRAFSSPTHPPLAVLGVDIEWNQFALWKDPGVYRPRIKLDPNVIRIPVVPGANPKVSYGDLYGRGVRGAVIESFGVGNVPDHRGAGWMVWLRSQQRRGLKIYLSTQCATGPLNPNLYNSGAAGALGATSTKRMTTETAVVKMMLCLAHPDLHLSYPLAGEL